MKICRNCKTENEDSAEVCSLCGSSDLLPVGAPAEPDLGNGNVIAGIVGAFLFALIGAVLYFLIYQMGIIAGISGLVIFVLANFGYHLFAKGNKNTVVGLVVSILMMVAVIFISEYVCLAYDIFQAYKDEDITIFDAIRATPEFLAIPEIGGAVAKDLAFAYLFGFLASFSNIRDIMKKRKKKEL